MRWQEALFERRGSQEPARTIVARSATFIEGWRSGETKPADYRALLEDLLPSFEEATAVLNGAAEAKAAVERIRAAIKGKLAAVQKAHRDYLVVVSRSRQ